MCSATCNGNQRRERAIIQHGRSGGLLCDGDIHETQPCNPGLFDVYPEGCGLEEAQDLGHVQSSEQFWHVCVCVMSLNKSSNLATSCYRLVYQGSYKSYSKDCKMSDWTEWSDCSATCGGHDLSSRGGMENMETLGFRAWGVHRISQRSENPQTSKYHVEQEPQG